MYINDYKSFTEVILYRIFKIIHKPEPRIRDGRQKL